MPKVPLLLIPFLALALVAYALALIIREITKLIIAANRARAAKAKERQDAADDELERRWIEGKAEEKERNKGMVHNVGGEKIIGRMYDMGEWTPECDLPPPPTTDHTWEPF